MSGGDDFVNERLRLLAEAGAALDAPARVEVNLLEVYRRQHRGRKLRRRMAGAVVAAAAVAACVTGVVLWNRPAQIAPPRAVVWRHEPPAVAWSLNEQVRSSLVMNARKPAPAQAHKPTYRPATDGLAASAFIPVPYGDASLVDESATVVRVELSGAALRAAGFAVAQERAGDRVQADLLVGADGLAHAVRFVGFQR